MGQRCHHGHHPLFYQVRKLVAVGAVYVANEAEVYAFLGQRPPVRANDVAVGAAKSDGIDPFGLQPGHEVLVHQSAIDHRHHLEHVGIGHAPAAYHLRLDAQSGGHLRGSAPAAVHEYLASLDGAEVFQQPLQLCLVFNDGTAHLHNCQFLFHVVSFFKLEFYVQRYKEKWRQL